MQSSTEKTTVWADRKGCVLGSRYKGDSDLVYFVAYNALHITTILRGFGDRMDVRFRNAKTETLFLKLLMYNELGSAFT